MSKAAPISLQKNSSGINMNSSTFKQKLRSSEFLITGEISPPKGIDVSSAILDLKAIQGFTDAINVTDNQCATLHMSSLAFARLMIEHGCSDPVMQLTCRDRNRIGLQADLLGAAVLGIPNILVMSGDHPVCGDHPTAKPVYDLDSVQLLKIVQELKNGFDFSGNALSGAPEFCVGVVSNADPSERLQMMKLHKKLSFDVDFIQTQAVFDIEKFKEFVELADTDVPIIAGIIPIRSAQMALYMDNNIPGITIPSEIHERIQSSENSVLEGMAIAAESIQELKKVCRGIHMMPVGAHTYTEKILKEAKVLD